MSELPAQCADPRGRPARRLPERARGDPDRGQGAADRAARRDAGCARIEVTSFVRPDVIPQLADAEQVLDAVSLPDDGVGQRADPERARARARARAPRPLPGDQRLPVGVRDPQPEERRPLGRGVAGRAAADVRPGARGGAALRGRDLDLVRLPVRGSRAGRAGAGDRLARWSTPGARRSGSATRPGWPTRSRCASSSRPRSSALPGVELTAHFHNTRGQGLANVLAALEAGVESFESSFGELGGCPVPPGATGNIATEDLVSMLHEMGIQTGVDLGALIEASRAAQEVLGRPLGSHVLLGRTRAVGAERVTDVDHTDALDEAVAPGARPAAPSATARRPPSRASCRSATGSRGCSTRARSPRRGCSRTGSRTGSAPTASSPGIGTIGGRPVAVMANDPTVKAGSWGAEDGREDPPDPGARAVAARCRSCTWSTPPGRGSTSRCRCSRAAGTPGGSSSTRCGCPGVVPQVCVLFGPSAAGGAYIPAFCDVVIMRDGNASMYLGSPRMAEMVIGEKVTLEEMGGARMHTSRSGVGHALVVERRGGDRLRQALPELLPELVRRGAARARRRRRPRPIGAIRELIPADENKPFDMRELLDALVDAGSFLEIHARWATRGDRRLRAPRRPRRSGSSPTSRRSRAACCSSTPPTSAPGSSGRATRSTSRCCSWPTCPGS